MFKEIQIHQRNHYKSFTWVQGKIEELDDQFNGIKVIFPIC